MSLQCKPTKVSIELVKTILKKHYDISARDIVLLPAYMNQNFKINCGDDIKFVLKAFNTEYMPHCKDLIQFCFDLQQQYMTDGITVSCCVPTQHDELHVEIDVDSEDGSRKPVVFQLLSYVEGTPLCAGRFTADEIYDLSRKMGTFVAKMHKSVQKLTSLHKYASTSCPYYLERTSVFKDDLSYISDPSLQAIVQYFISRIEKKVYPCIDKFRKGFLHGDLNSGNVLVFKEFRNMTTKSWMISGVIDFDISHYGCNVDDLCISAAYLMGLATEIQDCDPIRIANYVLGSYDAIMPLKQIEIKCMYDVLTSRMCASVTSAYKATEANPENKEFIFAQAKLFPSILRRLKNVGYEKITKQMFSWLGEVKLSEIMYGYFKPDEGLLYALPSSLQI